MHTSDYYTLSSSNAREIPAQPEPGLTIFWQGDLMGWAWVPQSL